MVRLGVRLYYIRSGVQSVKQGRRWIRLGFSSSSAFIAPPATIPVRFRLWPIERRCSGHAQGSAHKQINVSLVTVTAILLLASHFHRDTQLL